MLPRLHLQGVENSPKLSERRGGKRNSMGSEMRVPQSPLTDVGSGHTMGPCASKWRGHSTLCCFATESTVHMRVGTGTHTYTDTHTPLVFSAFVPGALLQAEKPIYPPVSCGSHIAGNTEGPS